MGSEGQLEGSEDQLEGHLGFKRFPEHSTDQTEGLRAGQRGPTVSKRGLGTSQRVPSTSKRGHGLHKQLILL